MIPCECGGCGSTYKVKDVNAGKRFQCKYCDSMVKVPAEGKSSRKSAGGGPPKRRRKAGRQQPESDDYEDYSADEYDSYGDDGYDDAYDDYDSFDDDQDNYARSPRRQPATKKKNRKTRRSNRRSSSGDSLGQRYVGNPLLWIGVPFGMGLLSAIVALVSGPGALIVAGLVAIFAGLVCIACGVHAIIMAFKEDPVCGLMIMIVPFYGLYYVITRWDEQREPFVIQLSMILMMLLTFGGAAVGS